MFGVMVWQEFDLCKTNVEFSLLLDSREALFLFQSFVATIHKPSMTQFCVQHDFPEDHSRIIQW